MFATSPSCSASAHATTSPVRDSDPGVRLQVLRIERPPLAKLLARERDRTALVEVGRVAGSDQRGDRGCVSQRRVAEDRLVVQSGWPDSNRRLLAPKASTLTRLSYTPRMAKV